MDSILVLRFCLCGVACGEMQRRRVVRWPPDLSNESLKHRCDYGG